MGDCREGEYLGVDGHNDCPIVPEGCSVHKELDTKIYQDCMKCCGFTSTPTQWSSTTRWPSSTRWPSPTSWPSSTEWSSTSWSSETMATGEIILIVLGAVVFIILCLIIAKYLCRIKLCSYKRRNTSDEMPAQPILTPSENVDNTHANPTPSANNGQCSLPSNSKSPDDLDKSKTVEDQKKFDEGLENSEQGNVQIQINNS